MDSIATQVLFFVLFNVLRRFLDLPEMPQIICNTLINMMTEHLNQLHFETFSHQVGWKRCPWGLKKCISQSDQCISVHFTETNIWYLRTTGNRWDGGILWVRCSLVHRKKTQGIKCCCRLFSLSGRVRVWGGAGVAPPTSGRSWSGPGGR